MEMRIKRVYLFYFVCVGLGGGLFFKEKEIRVTIFFFSIAAVNRRSVAFQINGQFLFATSYYICRSVNYYYYFFVVFVFG